MRNNGLQLKFGEKLGQGSFGQVYKCQVGNNDNSKTLAVKVTNISKEGIPSLLETSIMMTYDYEHINSCVRIYSDYKYTYMIQELALRDLAHQVRDTIPDPDTLKSWCHQIAQGVSCLHSDNIIHCDIKPSNILLYENNKVKLTDFTISVLKSVPNDVFCHPICTLVYRPPEVLLGNPWHNPVDIWSLGCTFYELATGTTLIPYQARSDNTKNNKELLRDRTLSTITDWRQSLQDIGINTITINMNKSSRFLKVEMADSWKTLDSDLRHLILWMTNFSPEQRPTITQVLNHPYFCGMKVTNINNTSYRMNSTVTAPLDDVTGRLIERMVYAYTEEDTVLSLTKDLYSRCVGMMDNNFNNNQLKATKIETCIWIATKLRTGGPPADNLIQAPLHQILEYERKICSYLGYKLHVSHPNQLYTIT